MSRPCPLCGDSSLIQARDRNGFRMWDNVTGAAIDIDCTYCITYPEQDTR